MNAPQQGTSTASAIAGALVVLIVAGWNAMLPGHIMAPDVQQAVSYLLTVAISFKTHGASLSVMASTLSSFPTVEEIKASVLADLKAAAETVKPAAAPAAAILLAIGLGVSACTSTQLEQANTDLQTIVAKVNTDIQTVSKDLPTVCAFVDDLNAGFGLVAQISTTVAAQSADEQLAYASAHAICTSGTPQDVPGAILSVASAGLKIQTILKPAVSSASQ